MQVQTSMCCFCNVKKEGRKEGKGEKEEERKEYRIPPQTHHKANAPTNRANWTLIPRSACSHRQPYFLPPFVLPLGPSGFKSRYLTYRHGSRFLRTKSQDQLSLSGQGSSLNPPRLVGPGRVEEAYHCVCK